MNLVALDIDSIPMGKPLPFSLRGANGALLAHKGFVVHNRAELEQLVVRGMTLCIDLSDGDDNHRAYLAQLQKMLMSDTALGEIAALKITAQLEPERPELLPPDWPEMQLLASQLLRAPQPQNFGERFQLLHDDLARRTVQAPDATLLALVHLSAQETKMYSATHAMLVAVACMITARETLRWPDQRVQQVGKVGLSMNIAMTTLQDQLAQQADPLTAPQIAAINHHAEHSAALLHRLGVTDTVWLEAVRCHHQRPLGPLAHKSEAAQLARLVQRADVMGARLAPRAARTPMPVTAAMQASYYDETRQVDEVGAAMVKSLGIYPPGALVRLASQEVGVVLRRGATATTPRVAVVLSRSGMPTGEMIPRDTAQPQWKITGPFATRELRVRWPLERLLALV